MAIWRSFIAEKGTTFGDPLLLNRQWQFCAILLLKSNAIWRSYIAE
jgi:hypothetical protein